MEYIDKKNTQYFDKHLTEIVSAMLDISSLKTFWVLLIITLCDEFCLVGKVCTPKPYGLKIWLLGFQRARSQVCSNSESEDFSKFGEDGHFSLREIKPQANNWPYAKISIPTSALLLISTSHELFLHRVPFVRRNISIYLIDLHMITQWCLLDKHGLVMCILLD